MDCNYGWWVEEFPARPYDVLLGLCITADENGSDSICLQVAGAWRHHSILFLIDFLADTFFLAKTVFEPSCCT